MLPPRSSRWLSIEVELDGYVRNKRMGDDGTLDVLFAYLYTITQMYLEGRR